MTQTQEILEHLKQGRSINPMYALQVFGCFRLGARVHEIKSSGVKIKSKMVKINGKTFSEYSLDKQ